MRSVVIEYFVTENVNRNAGGYLPRIAIDGRETGDTFAVRGIGCRVTALAWAKHEAEAEASKYRGDYAVTVRERS